MSSRERRITGTRSPVDLMPVHFVHCGQNVRGLVAEASPGGMKVVTVERRPTIRVVPDESTLFTTWTPDGMRSLTGSIRWASTGPHGNTIGVSLQDSVERNGNSREALTMARVASRRRASVPARRRFRF